jgi:peroxiredoxin
MLTARKLAACVGSMDEAEKARLKQAITMLGRFDFVIEKDGSVAPKWSFDRKNKSALDAIVSAQLAGKGVGRDGR